MNAILFECDHFLVINKPNGIGMHRSAVPKVQNEPESEQTPRQMSVIDWVYHLAPQRLSNIKLYLVHRLDTPTSGCLILAKNKETASTLSSLFAKHAIQKYYIALSSNKPKKKQGKISGDMLKSRNGSYKLGKSQHNPAITYFHCASYPSQATNKNLRLFVLKPITGKTHQLRVALKSLSSPILGDMRYKGDTSERMHLHCYSLAFEFNDTAYHIACMPEQTGFFDEHSLRASNIFPPDGLTWPTYKSPLANNPCA